MKQGWEIKKLGEIGKVSMCKRVFKEDTTPEGDIPFYKIGTFGKSPDAFITKAKYEEFRSKFSFPKKGDILISASGTIGRRVRYDGEPAYFQDSNIVWIDNNEKQVLNDYLYRFYEICNWKSTKGATISRLYNDNLKQIEIPFPKSLPEQQRIVSILDECFAAIDKAKANAEQNLKNAKELFESYLQGVFEKKRNGWEEKKLGEVCEIIGGGTPAKNNQKFYEGNIFWATVRDMKAEIIADTEFKINEDAVKKSSTNVIPKNNVIIATRVGLGKICKIQNDTAINQDLRGVIPKNKNLLGVDYLFYWFKSISSQIIAEGKGATVQGVTLPFIKGLEIPLPPLKEQQTIVRQLDALRAETQKLEAVYQKKIADLEELKKSILQKAFAGELSSSVSTNLSSAKVIPLQKVEGISPTDLQAGITAIALRGHSELNKQDAFGHVKAEKIIHLAEYILNIDLERNPVKDAAGPNDFPHAKKVESRAAKAGFYTVAKRITDQETGYIYTQGRSIDSLINKTQNCLEAKNEILATLLKLIVPMKTQQAEIVATVYAAWNNLIIQGAKFTDENIVTEARENWREEKLKIPREKFFKAIEWMRKNELLIPKGNGKIVLPKKN